MAKANSADNQVSGYVLGSQEGWTRIRAMEDDNAYASEAKFGIDFIQYEVEPFPKGVNVTITVFVRGALTANKAQWSATMACRKRHPSLWKENAVAQRVEGGFNVIIQWTLWNNAVHPETPF